MRWASLFDRQAERLRNLLAMYILTPAFLVGTLIGAWTLFGACLSYRALSTHGVDANARLLQVAEIEGKTKRLAVTFSFTASDGRLYVSKALFSRNGKSSLRPGHLMKIVYQRDLPTNNAPSLSYRRQELRAHIFVVVLALCVMWILGCVYRHDYKSAYESVRRRAAYA